MRRCCRIVLFCVLALAAARAAAAQETTGTLTGRVVDSQDLALPGVTITATGVQGAKTAVTDAEGRFLIPFLTPGTYAVRAELSGFKTVDQSGAIVGLGQTLSMSIKMQISSLVFTVTVRAAAPINAMTSTTGAVVSSDFAASVPVGRRVSDVAYMAPGVSSSGGVGSANPSVAGGSGLDNQYVIDGVNITNQGYGALGSYSIVFGSLGNATPFDFVKEVQVKTGGYEAEFGQAIGGVINVVTKSGSNDIRGSLFGYARPSGIESGWKTYQSVNGTVQTIGTSQGDGGGEVGAPLIRNHLFIFGAIDRQQDTTTLQAPAGFPLAAEGGIARTRRNVSYATKVTWQLSGAHRIDASFFGDPSTGAMGPQRLSALTSSDTSSFSQLTYGGHNQTVRYSGSPGSRWLIEATFARAMNHLAETPSVNSWRVTDQTVSPNVIGGGVGSYEAGNTSINRQWTIKSSNLFADHELRYGLEYDDVDYSQANQVTGPAFHAQDGRTTAGGAQVTILPDVSLGRIYRVDLASFSSARATTQSYTSFFVQDNWRAAKRLTVTPGIRYEQETMSGNNIKNFSLTGNWALRLGAAFDPAGDGRSKLFANFGRFYARVPNDLAARSLSSEQDISRGDYYDAQLTRPIPDGVVTLTPGGSPITSHFVTVSTASEDIDPKAKLSYTNEFVVGMEREVRPRLLVGVHYVYRSLGRVLEDIANVPMVAYDLGVPGISSVDYILTNPSRATPIFPTTQFLGASFDNPIHRYHAVDFTMQRTGEHWSVLGSYQWSRLRGNYEGFYRDDNGQSDPAISSMFDFPTNDPSYTSIGVKQFGYRGDIRYLGQSGVLPLDRPEQGKLFGTYTFTNGLSIGAAINLSSGKPLTPLAASPVYTTGGEIPEAPRGSGILTVDGFKKRTPFLSPVDLQASYDVKAGRSRRITLLAEVFNLFNERKALDYDAWTELQFGVPNPDFGKPISQITGGPRFEAPRGVRIGVRFSF